MQIPLTRGNKTTLTSEFTDNLLENMIVRPDPVLDVNGYIDNHYGLELIGSSIPEGVSRGGVYNDRIGKGYRVIGDSFIELNSDGSFNRVLGNVAGSGQVTMPFSFNTQAIITQSGEFYLYDETSGFREVNDPDLGDVFDGTWIDGYYFMVDKESPIVTDILAEDSIRQLSYGSAEIDPDPIRGCDKWRNFATVFGSSTMEYYENVGGTNYPFQRVESYTIYVGIVGTRAKVKLPRDAGFIILGGSRNEKVSFHFAVNGSAENISTKTVDRILDTYTEEELSTAVLEHIRDEDQDFIYAHLPKHTLIYDILSSQKLGFRQWSILKTGWAVQSNFKGYWQGINPVKMPSINEYTWGNRNNPLLSKFTKENCEQLGEQQEHLTFTPIIRDSKPVTINELSPQTTNGNNKINRYESISIAATQDGRSYSKESFYQIGDRGARFDQIIWRRVGFYRNWFGYRLRYVGKTNITLASLRVNE